LKNSERWNLAPVVHAVLTAVFAVVTILALTTAAPAQTPPDAPSAVQPLTPRQKFAPFLQGTFDPLVLATAGLDAAVGQAMNSPIEWGQGGQGYGKRFGAALAGQASNAFFGRFLFPVIFHQDPRYFRRGHGPFMHRVGSVLRQVAVTRTDSGRSTFNSSLVAGALVAGALANTYYPDEERGVGLTFSSAGYALLGAAGSNLRKEFWPDVRRKLFRGHDAPLARP
jgi:hypothetical protein